MSQSDAEKQQLEEGNTLQLDWGKLQKVVSGGVEVLPVVVQDVTSKEVLTLAYVDRAALEYTIREKIVAFYSTSRKELWIKGKTSGDFLDLVEIRVNCEQNSLLFLVKMRTGSSCHTVGRDNRHRPGCFYRRLTAGTNLEHIVP